VEEKTGNLASNKKGTFISRPSGRNYLKETVYKLRRRPKSGGTEMSGEDGANV